MRIDDSHNIINDTQYDPEYPVDEHDGREDLDMDVFNETFEHTLCEIYTRYAVHREQKGDSWQEAHFSSLICKLEEEISEFWDEFPGSLDGMHHEIIDILVVSFMLAERLADLRRMAAG